MTADLTSGDEWTEHYRGLTLHLNQDRECWWQVYNGTDRLYLDEFPGSIIDELLRIKPLGGRIRVTEQGDVLTRVDEDGDAETVEEYDAVWLGAVDLGGEFVPRNNPDMGIPVEPVGVSAGDLWPSVYDGARYSFTVQGGVWWHNSVTRKRHPVTSDLPEHVTGALRRHKPEGGSFRVTPTNDVITLISSPPTETIRQQFSELPAVVRNIIKLRKERGDVEMLPVYVGSLGDTTLEVTEPPSLTDRLSEEEASALEDWAANLGSTNSTSTQNHTASRSSDQGTGRNESGESGSAESDSTEVNSTGDGQADTAGAERDEDPPEFDDDPETWLDLDLDKTEERIDDR
jgi:hypothetical protein